MTRPSPSCRHRLLWPRLGAAAWVWAAMWAMPWAASAAETISSARALNDTGQIKCYKPIWGGKEMACAGTGQDGNSGRDVTYPKPADGYAGFSYRKISSTGEVLPASATEWACVQDRITGLTWEVKTADGGLRDWQRTYTHLNNGDTGDVSGLVRDVNLTGLCGHQDWRLPGRMELQSIINLGHPEPMIVDKWFPNTPAGIFWTSTRDIEDIFGGYWIVSFQYGVSVGGGDNQNQNAARLVRGEHFPRAEHAPGRFVADGDKVTDTSTGLVWRRCAEGRTWTGTTCTGHATRVNWQSALGLASAANYDGAAWRLPNATELFSLVDDSRFSPAIDMNAFPGVSDMSSTGFWSATPMAPPSSNGRVTDVFDVDFFSGGLATASPVDWRVLRLVRVDAP